VHDSGASRPRGSVCLSIRERLTGPPVSGKRPRRAAYALPTLFTSANIFLGFVAILQAFEGALLAKSGDLTTNVHFAIAAKALAFAVLFDGLDGRIARMTNTTSDFGRELDSLADVITFGIAPAVLVFVWGVLFVVPPGDGPVQSQLDRAGYLVSFFYCFAGLCGWRASTCKRIPCRRIRAVRTANISSGCRFRRAQGLLRRSYTWMRRPFGPLSFRFCG